MAKERMIAGVAMTISMAMVDHASISQLSLLQLESKSLRHELHSLQIMAAGLCVRPLDGHTADEASQTPHRADEIFHLCANGICVNPNHVADETRTENEHRKGCLGIVQVKGQGLQVHRIDVCTHVPKCIKIVSRSLVMKAPWE